MFVCALDGGHPWSSCARPLNTAGVRAEAGALSARMPLGPSESPRRHFNSTSTVGETGGTDLCGRVASPFAWPSRAASRQHETGLTR